MATSRSPSPFQLPPVAGSPAREARREAEPERVRVSRLPVSFGVLLLTSALVLSVSLGGSCLASMHVARQGQERLRLVGQRYGQQIQLLQASASAARSERELTARKLTAVQREIEQLKAELETQRTRLAPIGRRMHPSK